MLMFAANMIYIATLWFSVWYDCDFRKSKKIPPIRKHWMENDDVDRRCYLSLLYWTIILAERGIVGVWYPQQIRISMCGIITIFFLPICIIIQTKRVMVRYIPQWYRTIFTCESRYCLSKLFIVWPTNSIS